MPLRLKDSGGHVHARLQRAATQITRAAAQLADTPFPEMRISAAELDLINAARRVERDAAPGDRTEKRSNTDPAAPCAQILEFPTTDPHRPIAG